VVEADGGTRERIQIEVSHGHILRLSNMMHERLTPRPAPVDRALKGARCRPRATTAI
jgi:hypothetical protein